jgi:hypothetical protein
MLGKMLGRMAAEDRVLGLDPGDWLVLLGGSAIVGLVILAGMILSASAS